jgi:hypothetical protein
VAKRRFATRKSRKLFVTKGQRIGRGVVIDPEIRTKPTQSNPNGRPGARLLCDCGTVYETRLIALVASGSSEPNTKSCGCLKRESSAATGRRTSTTHGLREHELYGTWRQMLQRCENPKHKMYRWYGAKGRTVCERWHDVEVFVADIARLLGPRPAGMSLDRINNDGHYEPGNVRWATAKEQIANR